MTEALAFILHYGFMVLNFNRVEAFVGEHNIPSLKLMAKYKFTQEGRLREHYNNNGKMENSLVFSLLRDEYQ